MLDINDIQRSAAYDNLLPLEGPDGYRGIPTQTEPVVSGAAFVITDKCKYPEAAIKLADLFCGEEWSLRTQVGIKRDSSGTMRMKVLSQWMELHLPHGNIWKCELRMQPQQRISNGTGHCVW